MKPAKHTSERQSDILDPARAAAFQIALGGRPDITNGSPLPPFFHQLYFWSPLPPEGLGQDGHPAVGAGGLIPDLGLPRRMWAGGRLEFNAPLVAGQEARRVTVVDQVTHKQGRSGPLGFVTLRHDIRQGDVVCLSEWQHLVYREASNRDASQPVPPMGRTDATDITEVRFDTTLLFRYSALTFNGHRIHYDLDYAHDVEGYDGLVVHGPLLAQHLMLMATDLLGPLAGFSYRAVSALLHTEPAQLCHKGLDFWVLGPDGRLVMDATARPTS